MSKTIVKEISLGEPLGVRDVASIFGCSEWSVKMKLLPAGLPFFRSGGNGKLVFFRNQVTEWILDRQQKEVAH